MLDAIYTVAELTRSKTFRCSNVIINAVCGMIKQVVQWLISGSLISANTVGQKLVY